MRLCWFNDYRLGMVHEGRVIDVSSALKEIDRETYPVQKGDLVLSELGRLRPIISQLAKTGTPHDIRAVRFLSPVAQPTKIIGTPVNYVKHVEEAQAELATFTTRYQGGIREQGMFLKAVSALVGAGEGVTLRFPERRNDHEMELGVVIGKKGSNIAESDAMGHVAGYAIALDMVVRGSEDRSFRKSIDSYAVLGPWLVTADEISDPGNLSFSLAVNGSLRQASNTKFMILDIAQQLSWASQFYTLWPGDIIMTGTCEGVGPVHSGDVMHCEIEHIGAMEVAVK